MIYQAIRKDESYTTCKVNFSKITPDHNQIGIQLEGGKLYSTSIRIIDSLLTI